MSKYHFIGGDAKTYGPYTVEQMRQYIAENQLSMGSQVSKDDGPMVTAATFPELAAPPSLSSTPLRPDPTAKPGKLTAIAYMTLGGGIFSVLWCLAWGAYSLLAGLVSFGATCLCVPLYIYGLVAGIICILHGVKLIGARPEQAFAKTKTTAILQIICIIGCDPINLTIGILNLIFMKDEEVCRYVQSKGGAIPK